ncbi:MAG: hypothetical protein IT186_16045 [Acidobacteria bacterium]|nr:hypothetical protein [Acidobacteriota bacterium]
MTPAQLSSAFLDALLRYQNVITTRDEKGTEFFVFTRPEDEGSEIDRHTIVSFAEAHSRVWGVCCPCHNQLAGVFVPDASGRHWAVLTVRPGVVGIFEPGRDEPASTHHGSICEVLAGACGRYH